MENKDDQINYLTLVRQAQQSHILSLQSFVQGYIDMSQSFLKIAEMYYSKANAFSLMIESQEKLNDRK